MKKNADRKHNKIRNQIIENFKIEKRISKNLTATRKKLKTLEDEKETIFGKLQELKAILRMENDLQVCGQIIERLKLLVEEADNALLKEFKGYMAYKKTEMELGTDNNTEEFNKRFIKNLTDPSFVTNNNLESLKKEAREKYGIDFTN